MERTKASTHRQQEKVNAYFQSMSLYWKEVYSSGSVPGKIYRERQAAALGWIESLDLKPGSRVLEIGCGAGFLAVALSQRGLRVQAIDSTEDMVELAYRHAVESGVAELLSVDIGDAYALAFEDTCFDLVIALGVIPWLNRPELAMQQMARVVRPGGYIILTADNRGRLTHLLDPWHNPVSRPFLLLVKEVLERLELRPRPQPSRVPTAAAHSRRLIDGILASAGLVKTRGKTLGFGPFSFLQRRVLPEALGIALHHRLQCLADRGVPILRSTGGHYLVLAKKPMSNYPLDCPLATSARDLPARLEKHFN